MNVRPAHERIGMAKSDRSSENPQSPQHSNDGDVNAAPADGVGEQGPADQGDHPSVESENPVESRAERLRRIQQDVNAGRYDSDEMLEQALEIMLKRMSDDAEKGKSDSDL